MNKYLQIYICMSIWNFRERKIERERGREREGYHWWSSGEGWKEQKVVSRKILSGDEP